MTVKYDVSEPPEAKLEDILKSIRGIIDNNANNLNSTETDSSLSDDEEEGDENDNILELVNIIDEPRDDSIISETTKNYAQNELNKLKSAMKNGHYVEQSGQTLNLLINDLIHPMIKEWLNNNLPKIVKDIVSEEVKKIVITK